MNYVQLQQVIQDYAENTEALFVNNIPRFVMEAEDRIYNTVQLPTLRRNKTGTLTASNPYLSLPSDWLANYSLAIIDSSGNYTYLLNKDVNFIRESYPNPTYTGVPKYYALFGTNTSYNNEDMSCILAPTPDQYYTAELHYFYYPDSIVQGQIKLLGTITPGLNYSSGTYYNIPLSYLNTSNNYSGSGATATVTVAQGYVTNVVITNKGSLYTIGDILTINPSYIGGSGSGFQVTVTDVYNAAGTSWIGDNYDPVLFYGAMREAMIFMKGEQDMVAYYEKMFQEAIGQLKRLGDGLERNDAYRKGQTSLEYKGL
jgi:hypothetical protein